MAISFFKPRRGFTLAELLIALAILGVIATFTIPKILNASQDQKYNAMAKEAASTISQAYQLYQQTHTVTSTFQPILLAPYLSYVKSDSTSTYQDNENSSPNTIPCYSYAGTPSCYQLANGSLIQLWDNSSGTNQFGGTTSNNFVYIDWDPDGSGPAYDISFMLFYNGRIATEGDGSGITSWGGLFAATQCPLCNPIYWKNWN